jgi:hypothetical protein
MPDENHLYLSTVMSASRCLFALKLEGLDTWLITESPTQPHDPIARNPGYTEKAAQLLNN